MRIALLVLLLLPGTTQAGLYYSGESFAELPSRWSGFLTDHRALRRMTTSRPDGLPVSPLRDEYLNAAKKLEALAKTRALTADESADLGALLVRLGKPDDAVKVLRPAARANPEHFRLAANLGTAWQLLGDLELAGAALDEAIRLAPEKFRDVETLHRKLVQLRQREGKAALNPTAPDDLFGVKFGGKVQLPAQAAAQVQALALALPGDGRLLWLVGEVAFAGGDVRTAAAILDGCVTEFALGAPDLRERRREYRTLADELAKKPDHDQHREQLVAKSARPLIRRFDTSTLPPISADRPNRLPWGLLAETTLGPKGQRDFPKHLDQLDGKPVVLMGFVTPGAGADSVRFFLIEYPVGCWFCETPGPTGIVGVELAAGERLGERKGLVRVSGVLVLNRDDPEEFVFRVKSARVSEPE